MDDSEQIYVLHYMNLNLILLSELSLCSKTFNQGSYGSSKKTKKYLAPLKILFMKMVIE